MIQESYLQYIEWIAALAGIANVYLLTRQSIWAWPAGLLTVFLYIFVFWYSRLYSDVVLHIIYVILNAYGWIQWSTYPKQQDKTLRVSTLPNIIRFRYGFIIVLITLLWGQIMQSNTKADYVFADAFILVTSLIAQYLLAIKKIENWILWIIVDIVAILVYLLKDLKVTAGLYSIYLMLCILGWYEWKKAHIKSIPL